MLLSTRDRYRKSGCVRCNANARASASPFIDIATDTERSCADMGWQAAGRLVLDEAGLLSRD
jgi:hypothetical protein